mgnify:CR=1 FL=1
MINRRQNEFDDDAAEDHDFDDEDFDDETDYGDADDAEPTIACPWCREDIHEDSPQCPHCGNFLSDEDSPGRPKPMWLIVGVVLGLLVILSWIAV